MFIKIPNLVGYGMLPRLSKLTVSFMLAFKSVCFFLVFFFLCASYAQVDDQAGPRPESSWTEELQEAVLLSDQPVPLLCQVKRLGRRRKTKENVVLFPLSGSLFDTVQCLCSISLCFNSVCKMLLPFIYMTLLCITV